MRVAIDYTSALTQRAGVGRYTRSLVKALAELPDRDDLLLWFTEPGHDAPDVPSGAGVVSRRVRLPERLLTVGWHRLGLPLRLEQLVGSFDVAHAPDFVAPPSRAPIVATIHDLSYLKTPQYAHPNLRRFLTQAVPRTLRRAERIIAVSATTRHDILECYDIAPERVIAIPLGVDPDFKPPAEETVHETLRRLGLSQPYFLAVGTIEPRKNHHTLLAAFELLHRMHDEASLAIVGREGWLSEPIMDEIRDAEMRLPVRHLSNIDDEDLPALYAGATALVCPSWYEGFGLPVLEAMACGTATISSERGSLPEVAGDAGMIVPAEDADGLAEAMMQLLVDDGVRDDLIRRGLERSSRFTWERAARTTLETYRKAAG